MIKLHGEKKEKILRVTKKKRLRGKRGGKLISWKKRGYPSKDKRVF